MQFIDLIQSCPNWTLVDFYVHQGQNALKMENAPEWCSLLDDCFNNKVDLIITHKVSKSLVDMVRCLQKVLKNEARQNLSFLTIKKGENNA